MIGILVSTLFWNKVLDVPDENIRVTTHKVWESSVAPQSKEIRNRKFFESLVKEKPVVEVGEMSVTKKTIPTEITAPSQKVLVVAPHPDDEILCCAKSIRDHIDAGDDVSVVVITNGDGKEEGAADISMDYGLQRQKETLRTAKKLGIPPKKVFFLGFPDGGLQDIEENGSARSAFTELIKTMRASLFPGTPYTWNGLQRSLRKVLKKSAPDLVYLPSQKDDHEDHQAAARAVYAAAKTLSLETKWNEYVVHSEDKICKEQPVDIEKLALIREFRTQRHDRYHTQFLEEFAVCEEVFE